MKPEISEEPEKKQAPKKASAFGGLPTLDTRGGIGFKKLPKIEDLEKRRADLITKIEATKEIDPTILEERKKKIMEQREKMMEQKRKAREAALLMYEKTEVKQIC